MMFQAWRSLGDTYARVDEVADDYQPSPEFRDIHLGIFASREEAEEQALAHTEAVEARLPPV